jgi:hypothetical protein
MVCPKCKEQSHGDCPGGTWCDCAHRGSAADLRSKATEPAKILTPKQTLK